MNRKERRRRSSARRERRPGKGAARVASRSLPRGLQEAFAAHQAGRLDQALRLYRQFLAVRPENLDALNLAGIASTQSGEYERAVEFLEAALRVNADAAETHHNLGAALTRLGRLDAAEAAFGRAIELAPNYAEAHNELGFVLKEQGRLDEAEAALRRALAVKPDYAEAHNNLGAALAGRGQPELAVAAYRRALRARRDYAAAHHNLGVALKELGKFDEAEGAYRRALACKPDYAESYHALYNLRPGAAAESDLAAMRDLLDRPSITDREAVHLCFALGRAYEEAGDFDAAFRFIERGNRLQRGTMQYDSAAAESLAERIIATFDPRLIEERAGGGAASAAPIFIIGMARSGTTLIEQTLASHSQVYGCGELDDFPDLVRGLAASSDAGLGFPEAVGELSAAELCRLGDSYVAAVTARGPATPRFTDKMVSNFLYVGLIHLAVPNAKIIHCGRDPLDTCVSCYNQLFTKGMAYTYDLAELGAYHRRYQRLMRHWHALLPGRIHDVSYEGMIADQEAETRGILDFCGLDWEPACLAFHETERPVRTASAVQVRRPLYATSLGRWKRYKRDLGPLLRALEGRGREAEEAAPSLERAVDAQRAGRFDEALRLCRGILARDPGHVDALTLGGVALVHSAKAGEALSLFERAAQAAPVRADVQYNLGGALKELERFDEAAAAYGRAVEFAPEDAEAHNNLGLVLAKLGRTREGEAALRHAVGLKPDYAEAHNNLGALLMEDGRLDAAVAAIGRALEIKPGYAGAHNNLGMAMRDLGKIDEAARAHRRAIALEPGYAEAYANLYGLKSGTAAAEDITAMEALLSRPGLGERQVMTLCFALASAYESVGEYDRAFELFERGNRIKRVSIRYDRAARQSMTERMMAVFDREALTKHAMQVSPHEAPIFIVGMPRSGTTLVEQILASHSRIYGGGELRDLAALVSGLDRRSDASPAYPEIVAELDSAELRQLGESYVAAVRRRAPPARRFTDKLPGNFLHIGLIHLILPHAKIVHCVRDAVDTCLSCYKINFAGSGMGFAYDLEDLGLYYRLYERLMRHWKALLPGRILDMSYEALVAEPRSEIRKLLEFCELPWEDACLAFHETERAVQTASAGQVRRPLYQTSVGRWKHYERHLGTLVDALGERTRPAAGAASPKP